MDASESPTKRGTKRKSAAEATQIVQFLKEVDGYTPTVSVAAIRAPEVPRFLSLASGVAAEGGRRRLVAQACRVAVQDGGTPPRRRPPAAAAHPPPPPTRRRRRHHPTPDDKTADHIRPDTRRGDAVLLAAWRRRYGRRDNVRGLSPHLRTRVHAHAGTRTLTHRRRRRRHPAAERNWCPSPRTSSSLTSYTRQKRSVVGCARMPGCLPGLPAWRRPVPTAESHTCPRPIRVV